MAKKKVIPQPSARLKRTHSLRLTLNEREYKAILDHCQVCRIANRTGWIRSVIMAEVIREHELRSPLLFDEEEMR